MKKTLLLSLFTLLLISCTGGKTENKQETAEATTSEQTVATADASTVNVYYFHGKQRCKTCITVGDLTAKTIKETYQGNENVKFIEVDTSDKQFEDLVEKYEVSWNALIIAKGDQSVNLTEQAFANAINTPDVLVKLIKEEVNKNLN
ncbi:nitrophenyl compound nitroreductase subunit ArsF family protein [Dysgonomonas sp. ZJ709]|uniref:nitrophenyl compound nitroreductase subunit ArsF family protein n=1 Tax=Dysgonomonas sp. ZJ709 TaxID=2709797 RepID=UPI0013ECC610|nr:nitrophenyl compound nitroreductase subunit ArsF family protein [Dysgonomonas sp. ZJ709]